MPEGAGPLRARTPDQGFLSSVPSRRLTGVHPRGLTGVRPGVEMPRSGVRADYRAAPVPPYKSDARTEALNSKVRWVAGERLPAGVPGGGPAARRRAPRFRSRFLAPASGCPSFLQTCREGGTEACPPKTGGGGRHWRRFGGAVPLPSPFPSRGSVALWICFTLLATHPPGGHP